MLKCKEVFKIAGAFVLSVIFLSCDNFLAGSLLKEEIQKEIEYANAQEMEILISPELNQGTTIPSGTYKKKAGYDFEIKFTEASNYQFYKWIAVNSDTGAPYGDKVVFTDASSLSTTVLVKEKISNLWIKPVCFERPDVEKKMPEMVEEGVSRDSSIVLTFTKPLAAENDFSKIEITCSGEDVSSNFKTAVVNDTVLTIAADKSNLMEVENGKLKTVVVKIPSDFYIVENGINVPLGKDITHSYKINSSTNNKAEIIFSANAEKGTITPNGTFKYSIGETFTLSLDQATGFNFTQWSILDSEGKEVSDDVLKVEDKTALSTSITVLQAINGISITPVIYERPAVSEASPSGVDKENYRDSSIYITFNKNISAENDFSTIKIECDGVDVSSSFKVPVLNENVLAISANKTNLIEVSEGKTKTVKVTIPRTIFYEIDDEKIPLSADYVFSYIINSTTNDKAEICFSATNNYGTISPIGTINYDLGAVIDLSFIPNEGYKFIGWNVLDSDGNSLSDSILLVENADKEKTKITVKASDSGISISPLCVMLPAVLNVTPGFEQDGVSAITPIKFTFNMPVEPEDTLLSETEFTYENISIVSNGESVKELFENPVLSDDKKSLLITPNPIKVRNYITAKNVAYINITVTLHDSIRIQKDNEIYSIVQNEKSEVKLRYNATIESAKPVSYGIGASKTASTLELVEALPADKKFVQITDITAASNDDILKNVVLDKFYIYGKFYDKDSGISSIIIQETLERNSQGNEVDRTGITNSYDFIKEFPLSQIEYTADNNYTNFVLEYEIKSKSKGAVKLEIFAKDKCENISENPEILYAIIPIDMDIETISPINYEYPVVPGSQKDFYRDEYNANLKNIKIYQNATLENKGFSCKFDNTVYGTVKVPYDSYVFSCEYTNKAGTVVNESMIYDSAKGIWSILLDIDSVYLKSFKVTVRDVYGRQQSKFYSFPGKLLLEKVTNSGGYRAKFISTGPGTGKVLLYRDDSGEKYMDSSTNYLKVGIDYYPVALNGNLWGEIGETPFNTTSSSEISQGESNIKITDVNFVSKGENTGKYILTVTIDSNAWNDYETIMLKYNNQGRPDTYYTYSFDRETSQVSIEVDTSRIWNSLGEFIIQGVKGTTIYDSPSVKKDGLKTYGNVYDNINPLVNSGFTYGYSPNSGSPYSASDAYTTLKDKKVRLNKIYIGASDNGTSGLDTVEILHNNYKISTTYTSESGSYNYFYFPFDDFDEESNEIIVKAKDNNNNLTQKNLTLDFIPAFIPKVGTAENGYYIEIPNIDHTKNYPVEIEVFENISQVWGEIKYHDYNNIGGVGSKIISEINDNDASMYKNKWIRLLCAVTTLISTGPGNIKGYSDFCYKYMGDSSTPALDYLFDANNGVLLRSDKPVFVHTLVTKKTYSECVDWSVEKWEHHRKVLNEKQIDFTVQEITQQDGSKVKLEPQSQMYAVDLSQIAAGECYVVIAYFADGTSKMSAVHQK